MRILQIGKFYPIRGGVEKVMWDIADGLNARGVACDILCADAEHTGKWREKDFYGSGRCLIAPALGKMAATMISPAMVGWLRKHCGEYDIVHVHHPDPMACLALRLSGYKGKVVLHWHSDILKQKFFLKLYKPLQGWLVRRADRIVCTSPNYAEGSEALKDVQGKVAVIPIGVDPVRTDEEGAERIRRRLTGEPERQGTTGGPNGEPKAEPGREPARRKKLVFSLGRLVGYKGYSYLVEAASKLSDDYVLVIGGEGPLRSELESQIAALGLKDKVFLTGRIADEELPAWFNACDVFCLSSIWKTEAFAIVQIEAMSCAKPVVATKIKGSGVSWVNADGESGINVEPEDPEGLAEAIMRVCGEGYKGYCTRARMRYETKFTRKGMIDNCLKLYETV